MDWCVDTREPGALAAAEAAVGAHVGRHVLSPPLVELARPIVREALAQGPPGCRWVHLDWEDQLPRLEVRSLPDGPMPGSVVAPGVTAAQEDVVALLDRHAAAPAVSAVLEAPRPPESHLDPGPVAGATPSEGPGHVAGLLAAALSSGLDMPGAAAAAGASRAAQYLATHEPPTSAAEVARAVVSIEEELGAGFHIVSADDRRAVLANRRCPFGPSTPGSLCRFTSALAGTLAARAGGAAEITMDERLALGDHQCRMVVDLEPPAVRPTSHRYSWPPAGAPAPDAEAVDDPEGAGFRIRLSLRLPRDRASVPLTRHLVRSAMVEVGALEDTAAVELAVTEACANVVTHSGPGDAYEVSVSVDPRHCHIRVVDIGRGFDHESFTPPEMAGVDAEHGRGVALMHALVDQVRFSSEPERGTVVHLVKRLRFDETAPARRLLRGDA